VQSATITCSAADTQSGLASPRDASFTLVTTVASGTVNAKALTTSHAVCDAVGNCAIAGPIGPIKVDRQAPVVTCHRPTGWTRGQTASIPCSAAEHGSGLAAGSAAAFALSAQISSHGEGPAQTGSRRVCDQAGNCILEGPFSVKLDDRPPSISCTPVPAGWQASAVTVTCTASDYGSGVVPSQQVTLLRASVAAGTAGTAAFGRRQICDQAGNCLQTPALRSVEIDQQAPTVKCTKPAGGVHRSNVVVSCQASDKGSGLARGAAFTLATTVPAGAQSKAAFTGSLAVCDKVGNCITAGPFGPFDVDRLGQSAPVAPSPRRASAPPWPPGPWSLGFGGGA
jgi:hypothetical protein